MPENNTAKKTFLTKPRKARWLLLIFAVLFLYLCISPYITFELAKSGVTSITIYDNNKALSFMHGEKKKGNEISFSQAREKAVVLTLEKPEDINDFLDKFNIKLFILPSGMSTLCIGKYQVVFTYHNKKPYRFYVKTFGAVKLPDFLDKPLTKESLVFFRTLLPQESNKELDNQH